MAESVLPPTMIAGVSQQVEPPSLTYSYDPNTGRISGMVDGAEAVGQWIRHAITAERFRNIVYDSQFGSEITDLLGMREASRAYMESELKRMTKEAISGDSRITGIGSMEVEFEGDAARISFDVTTIYGTLEISEVTGGV